ncbi:MAG: hypothetical protein HONBIEJF_00727 [Fimbriimonadaceae bacterium]|nr:hypothetical protein [Fimbriimonadaceae bacterium]
MVELGFRLAAAIGAMLVSWILRVPNLDFAWKWSLAVVGYAVFAAILDRRNLKSGQSAELLAIADSAAISLILAAVGGIASFAFLAIVPVVYGVTARTARATVSAPIAVGLVIASQILLGTGVISPTLLAQCAAMLAIGLLLRPSTGERIESLAYVAVPPAPSTVDADVDLRDRFRRLKTYARELEQRAGRDKWVTTLFEAKRSKEGRLTERLSRVLKEQSAAEGVSLFVANDSRLVLAAAHGKLDTAIRRAAFELNVGQSDREIQERLRTAIRALADSGEGSGSRCILLRAGGRMIGMISVHHRRDELLDAAVSRIELAAPIVAALIEDERDRIQTRRRLKEMEILYDISSLVAGADKPENVLRRSIRDLWSEWEVDHIGAFEIADGHLALVEEHGAALRLLESMSFAAGPGVVGWTGLGLPELFLPDAADDQRVPEREAIRRRIGSFLAVPIADRYVVTVCTHHAFGISNAMAETMRLIAAELEAAVARLEGGGTASGLTHPVEFFDAVSELGVGWLCYLEPTHRSDLLESLGKPALDRALRQLAPRLRMVLPPGGLICRRDEGDFVAFLPGVQEKTAQSYLSEATALAAMVAVRTMDGKQKVPLALRGRLAPLRQDERVAS